MNSYLNLLPEECLHQVYKHVYNKCIEQINEKARPRYRPICCKENTNRYVVYCWLNNIPYKRGHKFKNMGLTTDGETLYSYALPIGHTQAFNKKVLLNYTAGGIAYYSQTTSCHVGLVRPYADSVVSTASGLLYTVR